MLQVHDQIVTTLQANGGVMSYADLLATLDYQQRQYLPKALAYGKQQGSILQSVAWNAETGTNAHTVSIGSVE